MQIILQSIIRTVPVFFLMLGLTLWMGRKLISQMTFFDFAVGVTIGSVAANMIVVDQNPVLSGLIVLAALSALTVLLDVINVKSLVGRKLTHSEPAVIVENGHINIENLRRTRLTLDELMMLLREKNTFNILDVEFALFEPDGKLSVLKKSQKQPITPGDLKLPTTYVGLNKDIVMDGRILEENLQDTHLGLDWLYDRLRENGVEDVKEVFYAGLDTSGNLYVSKKYKQEEPDGKYGIE